MGDFDDCVARQKAEMPCPGEYEELRRAAWNVVDLRVVAVFDPDGRFVAHLFTPPAARRPEPPREAPWWLCPNDPNCGHGAIFHDIEGRNDPSPTCCVEGCECGRQLTG